MFSKREGGFVFAILALLVFSGFFVSAAATPVYYTQNLVPSFESINVPFKDYSVSPMIGKIISYNVSVSGSCTFYIDYGYTDGSGVSSSAITSTSSTTKTGSISITEAVKSINRVTLRKSASCSSVGINALTISGRYFNASDNLPLIIPASDSLSRMTPYYVDITLPKPKIVRQISVSVQNPTRASCTFYVELYDSTGTKISAPGISQSNTSEVWSKSSIATTLNYQTAVEAVTLRFYSQANCDRKLNITEIALQGYYPDGQLYVAPAASTCVFRYSDWSSCNSSGKQSRVLIETLPTGCTGGDLEPLIQDCTFSLSCLEKCAQNYSSSLSNPYASLPVSCVFGEPCSSAIELGSPNGGNMQYDLIWKYNYLNGDSMEICACNGSSSISNHPVRVFGTPFNVTIADNNTRIISSVELKVYSFNGSDRSNYSSYTISNINYPCLNGCSVLGFKNKSSNNLDPSNYLECNRVAGTSCFNWTAKTCSGNLEKLFSEDLQRCINDGDYSCTGQNMFCNSSTRFLNNASFVSLNSCGLNSFNTGCYQCDGGFTYDSQKGYCSKCTGNQQIGGCEQNGGVCNNVGDSYGSFVHQNASLDCCNSAIKCFQCNDGYHFYNNTCISNNCTGEFSSVVGISFGINVTLSGNNLWTYTSSAVGDCQWNCSIGYILNSSDNRSCKPREVVNCSILGGICSNFSSLINAHADIYGNCSVANDRCYICDSSYRKEGNACVLKSCADDGKINNGIGCVQNMTCSDGCVLENKNGFASCARIGFKLIVNETKKYCDLQSLTFKNTLANNQVCNSHSECNSNFCFKNATASYCMDLTVVGGIQDTIIKFVCWFQTIGQSEASYNSCKANKAAAYLQ